MAADSRPGGPERGRDRGERRYLTVLFSDLSRSTLLGSAIDPEHLTEVLDLIEQAADRIVGRHRGTITQLQGDGLRVVFGLPHPHEDDVRRAIEAALDLHQAVREMDFGALLPDDFEARMHSGIHSGVVLAREGNSLHGRYELAGDAVNVAARFSDVAEADEILVSEATLRGALAFFTSDPMPSIPLEGKRQAIAVRRVLARSAASTRLEGRRTGGLTPFVGRRMELDHLGRCLRAAREGRSRLVALVGDAGLGKSRVLEEFVHSARDVDCEIHRGFCESYGGVAALQPLLQMLRRYFELDATGSSEEAVARVRERLQDIDPELEAPLLQLLSLQPETAVRQTLVPAIGRLFVSLAAKRPQVLILDDWQWVDDASRQAIFQLTQDVERLPVLFVLATRSVDPSDPIVAAAELLPLQPFDASESAETVNALLSGFLEAGESARVHEKSGGNPLFVEELCQAIADAGRSGPPVGVPATLHGLIEARVDRLSAAEADLLRAAAVVGNVVPGWLLEEISGEPEGGASFQRMLDSGLVRKSDTVGELRFKHGVTRDAVYESVRLRRRRELHLRIADALERREETESHESAYEAIAYHAGCSDDHERAAHYAQLAGDRALGSSSLDRAREYYGAVLAALDRLPQTTELKERWVSVIRRWALSCVYSPAPEHVGLLERSAEYARELGDRNALARIHYWCSFLSYALGDQRAAIAHIDRAIAIAEELKSDKLLAQFLMTRGMCQVALCDYPAAMATLDRAIVLKRSTEKDANPTRVPAGAAYAMTGRAIVHADVGDFPAAARCFEESLAPVLGSGDPIVASIQSFEGLARVMHGRWEECLEAASRTRATAAQVSGSYNFAMSQIYASYAQWQYRRASGSLETLRSVSEWLEQRHMCLYQSFNYACLADGLVSQGDLEAATTYGLRALERSAAGDVLGEAMACCALARVAAAEGGPHDDRLAAPEAYIERALASADARGSERERAVTRLQQARVQEAQGDEPGAAKSLDAACEVFRRLGMAWHLSEADEVRARIESSGARA